MGDYLANTGDAGNNPLEAGNDELGGILASFLGGSDGSGTNSGGGADSGSPTGDGFDADIHIGRDKRNADGSYTAKRKRRGSGDPVNRKSKKDANNTASLEALTRMVFIIHVGVAGMTRSPEWTLDDKEAETLSGSLANVMEQFDIRPDPKIEAIVGLCVTATSIYGPRVYMIQQRKKVEKEA